MHLFFSGLAEISHGYLKKQILLEHMIKHLFSVFRLKDRLSSFQTCFQTRTKLLSLTLLKKLRTKLKKRNRRKLMTLNVEMFLTGFGIDRRSAVLGWGPWRDMNTFHPVLDFLF